MRNVSGYLTDDGKFFSDKKEAEAHERLMGINKLIEDFLRFEYDKTMTMTIALQAWEKYKTEKTR